MSAGALSDVHVLDLCGPFGSFGAKMLADLGADVVKVEPPGGEAMRRRGPFAPGEPDLEASLPFFLNNANKRGIVLDLEAPEGREAFTRLARTADVVMESLPPGWMSDRGIGYDELSQGHPRLIWVAVTPFGQDGPYRDFRLSEISAQAIGGALYLTGEKKARPVMAGGHVAEKMAGYLAALAAVTALYWRDTSGRGQFIDLSTQEAVVSQMESFTTKVFYSGEVYSRDGRLYPRTYPAGLFPCADGWVSLVAGPRHQWVALREWVADGRLMDPSFEDLAERMRQRPYLDEILCAWTRPQEKQALFEEGQRRRIPVGVSFGPEETALNEHLRERDYVTLLRHARLGEVEVPGRPYLLSGTPWALRRPAPLLGEHTAEVLAEAGLSPAEVAG